jgi:hypothetical protein
MFGGQTEEFLNSVSDGERFGNLTKNSGTFARTRRYDDPQVIHQESTS